MVAQCSPRQLILYRIEEMSNASDNEAKEEEMLREQLWYVATQICSNLADIVYRYLNF
jgi:hypothetical protein